MFFFFMVCHVVGMLFSVQTEPGGVIRVLSVTIRVFNKVNPDVTKPAPAFM